MTEPTRTRLARIAHFKYFGVDIPDDLEAHVWGSVVDAILDELMNPGAGAHEVADHWMVRDWQTYRNIITAIKAGK